MGLNDVAIEGQFVWTDNTPLTYLNWSAGEPNNWQGAEDYTQFRIDGKWNDVGVSSLMSGIIEVPIGGNFRFFNKHEYRIDNIWQNWDSVRSKVLERGGDLAAINSAAEQSFIETNLLNGPNYFIGLNDLAVEGSFVWSNQQTLGYSNWNAGEPNNWQGLEDVAMITSTGRWNDVNPTSISRALQEYEWR